MDRIRTLLLARTHVVVIDPDLVASASTRPSRDADAEKVEDELAQLGFVMSLDLATMMRRLPHQTVQEMRGWLFDTLAKPFGTERPRVPQPRGMPRIASWLITVADQPCPWCGQITRVGALDPCGHLVCRPCWEGAQFAGCPICHRRVAAGGPFFKIEAGECVGNHPGTLTLLHLGFDLMGTAKLRFQGLLSRMTLSPADRDELEAMIDTIGPKARAWLPARIASKETLAIAVARLVLISPNRAAMLRELTDHLRTAADLLRVIVVVMGGSPALVEPMRLRSPSRGLRRALLEALERLPLDNVVEDMMRQRSLWKRVGERLHPFEYREQLPNTTLAFAVVRGTKLDAISFGAKLREQAVQQPFLYLEETQIRHIAWAGPIEDALRLGNPRSALVRLTHRPSELLRRADHLVRVAQTRQLDALQTILKAIELASAKGPPGTMLTLASHVSRRGRAWPRRVFFPHGKLLDAWGSADTRIPLRGDATAVIVGAIRRQLLLRAEARRQFPRAIIDRGLVDLVVPTTERPATRMKLAWPRGSEVALPSGQVIRLFLHWEQSLTDRVDLDLAAVLYDASWRHVATCDAKRKLVAVGAATHSGDVEDAPAPLGATEYVDLHHERLAMHGVRHVVMVVFCDRPLPFERLTHGFAGVVQAPEEGQYFDPRAASQRFDLRGRSPITIPLTIDLAERRLRWLDIHISNRRALHDVGGYHAALAHLGHDFHDLFSNHARPTLWDVACIHAAARGNVVYVRERDGQFTTYRRRDNESKLTRLSRLMSGAADDGRVTAIPAADAPTWFALTTGMTLPKGSTGYALDRRNLGPNVELRSASDLIAELTLP